jgi:DNA-binding NarL/FixJ family response regulator
MYHGINIHHDMGDGHIVDLRVWRHGTGSPFAAREVDFLNTQTAFVWNAVSRQGGADRGGTLTAREREIAQLIARGCTDLDIARMLRISFSTVRTHVNRCFEKLGCANRAELSGLVASTLSHPI